MLPFKSILLMFLLSWFNFSNSQDLEEILEPKCDGKKIEYSISVNLKEYIDNDHNIDNREIYTTLKDLKDKKIALFTGTYVEDIEEKFNNVENYPDVEVLSYLVSQGVYDAGITFEESARAIQMFTNALSIFPETLHEVECGFGFPKENTQLRDEINSYIDENPDNFASIKKTWLYINSDTTSFNTTLGGKGKTLNVIAKAQTIEPYCYVRKANNATVGAEVEYIYKFAR